MTLPVTTFQAKTIVEFKTIIRELSELTGVEIASLTRGTEISNKLKLASVLWDKLREDRHLQAKYEKSHL